MCGCAGTPPGARPRRGIRLVCPEYVLQNLRQRAQIPTWGDQSCWLPMPGSQPKLLAESVAASLPSGASFLRNFPHPQHRVQGRLSTCCRLLIVIARHRTMAPRPAPVACEDEFLVARARLGGWQLQTYRRRPRLLDRVSITPGQPGPGGPAHTRSFATVF